MRQKETNYFLNGTLLLSGNVSVNRGNVSNSVARKCFSKLSFLVLHLFRGIKYVFLTAWQILMKETNLSFSSDFWLSLGQFLSRRFFFSDFQPPILVFVAACRERFFWGLRGLTMRSRSNAQFSLPWSGGGMGIDALTILKSQPQYNQTK